MKRLTKSQYEDIAATINAQVLYYNISADSLSQHERDFVRHNMRGMKLIAEALATRFAAVDSEFKKKMFLNNCGQAFWKYRSL